MQQVQIISSPVERMHRKWGSLVIFSDQRKKDHIDIGDSDLSPVVVLKM